MYIFIYSDEFTVTHINNVNYKFYVPDCTLHYNQRHKNKYYRELIIK